jgi:response regulator RpfG family c-di-GMP phosphodiesterase
MSSERILAPIPSLRSAREIILHSADRFDAVRLPFGVERSSIPIESRILSVCEDYIRLTQAEGADAAAALRALDRLRAEAGRKHDPDVIAALCRVIEKGGR